MQFRKVEVSQLRLLVESKWRDSPQRSREALVSGDGRTQYPSLLSIAVYFRTHPLRSCKPAFGVHLVYVEFLSEIRAGNICLKVSSGRFLRRRMQITSDKVF